MTIKRILLLAAATMAFAAPAAANAAQWTTFGMAIGGATEKQFVTLDGFLTMTAPGIVLGECEVHAETELWNEGGVGTGTVFQFNIVTPDEGCHGTFAGGALTCPAFSAGPIGLPWDVDTGSYESTEEEGTNVNITGAGFFYTFFSPCPGGVAAAGNTTGSFNNTTSCIEFEEDGDLIAFGAFAKVELDGSICETFGNLELD